MCSDKMEFGKHLESVWPNDLSFKLFRFRFKFGPPLRLKSNYQHCIYVELYIERSGEEKSLEDATGVVNVEDFSGLMILYVLVCPKLVPFLKKDDAISKQLKYFHRVCDCIFCILEGYHECGCVICRKRSTALIKKRLTQRTVCEEHKKYDCPNLTLRPCKCKICYTVRGF